MRLEAWLRKHVTGFVSRLQGSGTLFGVWEGGEFGDQVRLHQRHWSRRYLEMCESKVNLPIYHAPIPQRSSESHSSLQSESRE